MSHQFVSVTGWLDHKASNGDKEAEWAREILNFVKNNQILERYLLPNAKYNVGVSFLLPPRPTDLDVDGDNYSERMYDILCRCIVPCMLSANPGVKTVPSVFKDNSDGIRVPESIKHRAHGVKSIKEKTSHISFECYTVAELPEKIENVSATLQPPNGKIVVGGKAGEEDEIKQFTRKLLDDFKTNIKIYRDDTTKTFCDPFLRAMNLILTFLRKSQDHKDTYKAVCKILDLYPIVSYFIIVQPYLDNFSESILSQVGLCEHLRDAYNNQTIKYNGTYDYLSHFTTDHGLSEIHSVNLNVEAVKLIMTGKPTENGIMDKYNAWSKQLNVDKMSGAKLLNQDRFRFGFGKAYNQLFSCGDYSDTAVDDTLKCLKACVMTYLGGKWIEQSSEVVATPPNYIRFILSSDFCYISPVLKEDNKKIYAPVFDGSYNSDNAELYVNNTVKKLNYLTNISTNTKEGTTDAELVALFMPLTS